MMDIALFKDIIDKCSHCAFCEAVCPVFREDLLETHVARSRMLILREALIEKRLPVTKRVREIVNRCLLCGQCKNACPAGVPVDDIVIAGRSALQQGKGKLSPKRFLLNQMMAHRGDARLLRTGERMAAMAGADLTDYPRFARTLFSEIYPSGIYEPVTPRRATVAYYPGCATNVFYPDTGEAVMQVLSHNGVSVIIPDKLVCCGIPALASGDIESAQAMMEKNIEQLSQVEADWIVTDCSSCLMTLKEKTLFVIDSVSDVRQKAEAVSRKMTDVMAFLNGIGLVGSPPSLGERVTFHIPCHAKGKEGLANAPFTLLSNVEKATLIPQEEDSGCCGAGGTFFTGHKRLSQGLREKRCSAIRRSGASTVLTQCPSCRTYIQAGLGCEKIVTHPMVFLARAYGFPISRI